MKTRSEHQPEERHACVQGTAIKPGPTSQERGRARPGGAVGRAQSRPPRPRLALGMFSGHRSSVSQVHEGKEQRPEDNGTATSEEERCLAQPLTCGSAQGSERRVLGRATAGRQGAPIRPSTPTCGQRRRAGRDLWAGAGVLGPPGGRREFIPVTPNERRTCPLCATTVSARLVRKTRNNLIGT